MTNKPVHGWCKLHDLPEPCDKCQAKTPDVREAVAETIKEYEMQLDQYNSSESLYCWSTETVVNKVLERVQPLIEAAGEARKAQDTKALKAVGEWLWNHKIALSKSEWDAFISGEMPKK